MSDRSPGATASHCNIVCASFCLYPLASSLSGSGSNFGSAPYILLIHENNVLHRACAYLALLYIINLVLSLCGPLNLQFLVLFRTASYFSLSFASDDIYLVLHHHTYRAYHHISRCIRGTLLIKLYLFAPTCGLVIRKLRKLPSAASLFELFAFALPPRTRVVSPGGFETLQHT